MGIVDLTVMDEKIAEHMTAFDGYVRACKAKRTDLEEFREAEYAARRVLLDDRGIDYASERRRISYLMGFGFGSRAAPSKVLPDSTSSTPGSEEKRSA